MKRASNQVIGNRKARLSLITLFLYLSFSLSTIAHQNYQEADFANTAVIQALHLDMDANQVRPISLLTAHQSLAHRNSIEKIFFVANDQGFSSLKNILDVYHASPIRYQLAPLAIQCTDTTVLRL
jgi:hypothetical protein